MELSRIAFTSMVKRKIVSSFKATQMMSSTPRQAKTSEPLTKTGYNMSKMITKDETYNKF